MHNTLIAGASGTGGTITLKHLAFAAIDAGQRVELISIKEGWGHIEGLARTTTTMSRPGQSNEDAARRYAAALLEVEPGSSDEPLFLGLDNFTVMLRPRCNEAPAIECYGAFEHLQKLLADPFTSVAVRIPAPFGKTFPSWLSRHIDVRILMGHPSSTDQIRVFGESLPVSTDYGAGTGYMLDATGQRSTVTIPWDDRFH